MQNRCAMCHVHKNIPNKIVRTNYTKYLNSLNLQTLIDLLRKFRDAGIVLKKSTVRWAFFIMYILLYKRKKITIVQIKSSYSFKI